MSEVGEGGNADEAPPHHRAPPSQSLESQTTFISYGGPDAGFARKLNDALRGHGIKTFLFERDALPGQRIGRVMLTGVNEHDRVILICSESSLERPGVLTELTETLAREARDGGAEYLIPIRIDDYVFSKWTPQREDLKRAILDRVVADFSDPARFREGIKQLLRTLNNAFDAKTQSKLTRSEAIELLRNYGEGTREWNIRRASGHPIPNLSSVDLGGVSLLETNLRSGSLDGANLRDARLVQVDLRDAVLERANLAGAHLLGCDLRGAKLKDADANGVHLSLDTALTPGAHLLEAKWDTLIIDEIIYNRADVEGGMVRLPVGMGGENKPPREVFKYNPYPVGSVEELESLTRNRAVGEADAKDRQVHQAQIDALVRVLKRSPESDDTVVGCRLVRIIGKGNYGTVWQALDPETGSQRAVKIFDSDRLGLGTSLYHFRRGVRAMKHLSEDSKLPDTIVRLLAAEDSGLAFAMPLLDGGDLTNIDQRGWSRAKKLQVFQTVCDAVHYAHEHKIVHRDIKPANIVMHRGSPVLTDFDIADLLFAKTRSAQAAGTVNYAAPEALRKGQGGQGIGVDIYSLGRLLHFFLLEEDPYPTSEDAPLLRDLEKHPKGLVHIVRKCTMFTPTQRYLSVLELLADLARHEAEPEAVGIPAQSVQPHPINMSAVAKTLWATAEALALDDNLPEAIAAAEPALRELGYVDPALRKDWNARVAQWNARLDAQKLSKAQDMWRHAEALAAARNFGGAISAGKKALSAVEGSDHGLFGTWDTQLTEWNAKHGNKDAGEIWWRRKFFGRVPLGLGLGLLATLASAGAIVLSNVLKWVEATQQGTSPQVSAAPTPARPSDPSLNPTTKAMQQSARLIASTTPAPPSTSPIAPQEQRRQDWFARGLGKHFSEGRARPLREKHLPLGENEIMAGGFQCNVRFDEHGNPSVLSACKGTGESRTTAPITSRLNCSLNNDRTAMNCESQLIKYSVGPQIRGGRFVLTLGLK